MKRILIIILVFISNLHSQEISYLLPDIGAPGMGIYLEIIGPTNQKTNFGDDGFYDNSQFSTIRVEPTNLSDNEKISFGPIVVSWEGRMISTQVFVNPKLTPNSSDWTALNSEFKIPINVIFKGIKSNIDTFYIIKPYNFGDISGLTDRNFGDGNLGKRSRRGAMIVDSLILANSTYMASVKDCDPLTEGNQGYLPFILLSKGRIIGGANSTISVDAGLNGNAANGGPGGGGGGGRYCDLNNSGSNGGDGFTGGGPGGTNLFNNSMSYRREVGNGTGKQQGTLDNKGSKIIGGNSLNGVIGGKSSNDIYETAGGGTGHPFGLSARDCAPGSDCDNNIGGYGAGGGFNQDKRGGSAGYGSAGSPSDNGGKNGGQIHGNIMGIPLAGGSGGGSGNPKYTFGGCAGEGGGGGGAIRVSAKQIVNLIISANGKNGGNQGVSDEGGGGSGGLVDINSKMTQINVTGKVNGGNRAGFGYARFNNPDRTLKFEPTNANPYLGPVNDSTEFIERISQVTGTFASGTIPKVFLKAENQPWIDISSIISISGDKWTYNFNIKNKDTLYYISAFQSETDAIADEYNYIQQHVFSQASSNVLRKIKSPIIDGDSVLTEQITACPDEEITKTFKIENKGDADLNLDWSKAYFKSGTTLQFISFTNNNATIIPDNSVNITLKIKVQKSTTISDTLFIPHNDKFAYHKPWAIAINIILEVPSIQSRDTNNIKNYDITLPNSLYIGEVCWGDEISSAFVVYNNGKVPLSVKLESSAHQGFDMTLNGNKNINPGEKVRIDVLFKSYNVLYSDSVIIKKYYIYSDNCTKPLDSIMIYALMNRLDFEVNGISNPKNGAYGFIKVIKNTTSKGKLTLKNKNKKNLISTLIKDFSKPQFKLITNLINHSFKSNISEDIEFTFTPKDTSYVSDSIKVLLSDGICEQIYTIYVFGTGLPVKQLTIRIDSVISLPSNRDLNIPIYGFLDNKQDSIKDIPLIIYLSYKKSLFLLNENQDFVLESVQDKDKFRNIIITVKKYEISSKDSLICYLKGSALLGDTIKTPIIGYSYFEDGKIGDVDSVINGSLEIIICHEGGDRLVTEGTPQKMAYFYKNSSLSVDINVLAVGNYKLELFNLNGESIIENKWEHILSNDKNYNFNFNLSRISNGIYYLRLNSPSGIITQPVMIID